MPGTGGRATAASATASQIPKSDTIPVDTYSSNWFAPVKKLGDFCVFLVNIFVFFQLPVQQEYLRVFYRTFNPLESLSGGGNVISFCLPRMQNTQVYLLDRISILVSIRIVDKDGNVPAANTVVAPQNDVINR